MGLPDVAKKTIPPHFYIAPSARDGNIGRQLGYPMSLREMLLERMGDHGAAHNPIVLPFTSLAHGSVIGQV